MKQLIDHVQMDAFIQYRKQRNEFNYIVTMNVYKSINDGIEPHMIKETYTFKGKIVDCHAFITEKWDELYTAFNAEYPSEKLTNTKGTRKNYRGVQVIDTLSTYNLIKKA